MGLSQRPMTTEGALAWFDTLAPVTVEEMLGRWAGREVDTGHRLRGLLARSGWRGKDFRAAQDVDPLVFPDGHGGTYSLDPRWVPLSVAPWLPRPLVGLGGRLVPALRPVLRARGPQARLLTVEHRGVCTAAMVYDRLPATDVFRRVDSDKDMVLGLMELRGEPDPFFFVLDRRG